MDKYLTHKEVKHEEFVESATNWLKDHINESIKNNGFCIIGLSGGNTPKPIYELLGKDKSIDWSKVHVFLVDDRYISKDHKDSNQNLVNSTLLLNATIPKDQLYFPDTSLSLEEYLKDYESKITKVYSKGEPDILTLGLGEDGHIASLFPPVVEEGFSDKHAIIHTTTEKFAVKDRASLTLPYIQRAKKHVFFLQGQEKMKKWNEMMNSEEFKTGNSKRYPAYDVIKEKKSTLVSSL